MYYRLKFALCAATLLCSFMPLNTTYAMGSRSAANTAAQASAAEETLPPIPCTCDICSYCSVHKHTEEAESPEPTFEALPELVQGKLIDAQAIAASIIAKTDTQPMPNIAAAEAEAPTPSAPKFKDFPEMKAPAAEGYIFVKSTKTRVPTMVPMLKAEVLLDVSVLEHRGGKLTGTYAITVPLQESKNEAGDIHLPTNLTFEQLAKKGATLKGTGYATTRGGEERQVTCIVKPGKPNKGESTSATGNIELTIDTGTRILEFESTYELSNTPTQ